MLLQKSKIYERNLFVFKNLFYSISKKSYSKISLKILFSGNKEETFSILHENNTRENLEEFLYEALENHDFSLYDYYTIVDLGIAIGSKKVVEFAWNCLIYSDDYGGGYPNDQEDEDGEEYLGKSRTPEVIDFFFIFSGEDTCRVLRKILEKKEKIPLNIFNFFVSRCCFVKLEEFKKKYKLI